MSVARIKKNDTVIAIAGESAGKTGKVLRVLPKKGKAVVQGLNMVKKAIRRSQTAPEGGFVALKIFRTSNATFKNIARYIEGDPRFVGLSGNTRKLIYAWTTKEFKNLCRMEKAGVRVPSAPKNSS